MNHFKNETEIDLFQCDCIKPRVKIDQTNSKGIGNDWLGNDWPSDK